MQHLVRSCSVDWVCIFCLRHGSVRYFVHAFLFDLLAQLQLKQRAQLSEESLKSLAASIVDFVLTRTRKNVAKAGNPKALRELWLSEVRTHILMDSPRQPV